jgi:hypothetical protein
MEAISTFTVSFTMAATATYWTLPAGAWFTFEYSRGIPPKLNAKGKLYCEFGFNTTMK